MDKFINGIITSNNASSGQNNILIRNAFLAGACSASLLWGFVSWSLKKKQVNQIQESTSSNDFASRDDEGEQQLLKNERATGTIDGDVNPAPYNPWKTEEEIHKIPYRQLLELRTSLIDQSKRTSLKMLDKILSQTRRIGELPMSKKRIRWPWESLRRSIHSKHSRSMGDMNMAIGLSSSGGSGDSVGDDDEDSQRNSSSHIGGEGHNQSKSQSTTKSPKEKAEICIGSIFGLDVGGTLSKLVYFEKKRDVNKADVWDRTSSASSKKGASHRSFLSHSTGHSTGSFDFPSVNGSSHSDENLLSRRQQSSSCEFAMDDISLQTSLSSEQKSFMESPKTMKRSHSLFDLTSKKVKREEALERFYEFARRLDVYDTEVKDKALSFYSRALGGELHFIQFETRYLSQAMDLIKFNDLHLNISRMGATGGGAHKYSNEWEQQLGIEIAKQDELDSMVAGMQFSMSDIVGECYTFKPPQPDKIASKQKSNGLNSNSSPSSSSKSNQFWLSRKVKRDFVTNSDSYPYLLVMIGTGVSVLRVDGPRKHERISGSTIGGGTYWGLCRLLTDVEDFESVLNLAEKGDPSKVDMMVGDIYGDESDALDKLGLTKDIVASSFGKLVAKQDPADGLKQEDLARALLLMVTNNIGQVSYLNAQLHGTKRIYFVGNFLRHNKISQQRLAYAINYWSQEKMEALFLEHEGYYGALGSFLLHQGISADKDGRVAQTKADSHGSHESMQHDKKQRSMSF
jgi:type II pantothenate kinase